jgi:tRNA(adenine34) deaminase
MKTLSSGFRRKLGIGIMAFLVMFVSLVSTRSWAEQLACRAPANAAEERDEIFTLLAYSVVLKDWQNAEMKTNRGYNIGSVLVRNSDQQVVYWARNGVNITKNHSQHGEIRLMSCYVGNNKTENLSGYTVYTTLEPCAQCAGMMYLLSMPRSVYGQTDPFYGNAMQRLQLDSRALPEGKGYPPYPRSDIVSSVPSFEITRCALDALFSEYMKKYPQSDITHFLATDDARGVYMAAYKKLMSYNVSYSENQEVLIQALAFFKQVPVEDPLYCINPAKAKSTKAKTSQVEKKK